MHPSPKRLDYMLDSLTGFGGGSAGWEVETIRCEVRLR